VQKSSPKLEKKGKSPQNMWEDFGESARGIGTTRHGGSSRGNQPGVPNGETISLPGSTTFPPANLRPQQDRTICLVPGKEKRIRERNPKRGKKTLGIDQPAHGT